MILSNIIRNLATLPTPSFPSDEWIDYLALGINKEEEQELVQILENAADLYEIFEKYNISAIHIYRALALIKNVGLCPLFIKHLFIESNQDFSFYTTDFPKIIGMFGAAALPYLKPLLLETNTFKESDDNLWIKSSIITAALAEIVKTSPETRQEAIETVRVYITDILCSRDNFFIACTLSSISSIRPIELKDRVFELLEANRIDYEGISEEELAMVLGED